MLTIKEIINFIFSVKNKNGYKVWKILGLEYKFILKATKDLPFQIWNSTI